MVGCREFLENKPALDEILGCNVIGVGGNKSFASTLQSSSNNLFLSFSQDCQFNLVADLMASAHQVTPEEFAIMGVSVVTASVNFLVADLNDHITFFESCFFCRTFFADAGDVESAYVLG